MSFETPKAVPVTLLSGFLGSGKTTLLKHILQSNHGLRIAVIVNDIGAVNVDANLIKQTHVMSNSEDRIISLQNGCICCTLRGDLLEKLVNLSRLQEYDYIVIESSGISEPEQVAETFDQRLAEQMDQMSTVGGEVLDEDMLKVLKQIKEAGGLEKFARLDTTVTVVDACTMLNDFDTDELMSKRRTDVPDEDERTVSDLLVDQIEFADVIVLNKIDMVKPDLKARLLDMLRQLNHRAKIIESTFSKIDVKEIVNTGLFSIDVAQTGYGWLQDLHAMTMREINGRNVITPKPETEEYNVRNFVYSRPRPFHPFRLFQFIHDKFILQLEHEEEDEEDEDDDEDEDEDMDEDSTDSAYETLDIEYPEIPSSEVAKNNKRKHPVLNRLFRSKGEFFLASRPHRCGEWSQAGPILRLEGGRPWFITLPPEEYITGDGEIDALLQHDMKKGGEWGDRRQEIVFIGENLDHEGVAKLLDECLLTDGEFEDWERVMRDKNISDDEKGGELMRLFEDGFPTWPGDEGDEEDHDHDHHSHDHHHHHHSHKNGLRSIKEEMQKLKEVD